jgi:CheY-like chemotaxis protein
MLRRLIGEDVELVTLLKPTVGKIEFDRGQLSQIIMNLTVNARDAMPGGGKLTIETANTFLGPEDAGQHVGILPGAYVMLSVTDTGVGIPPEARDHIFEPFFTTKEVGKGTGLGLATVYGIVQQSGGGIFVYSEPGHGTTFKIYIPRVAGVADDTETEVSSPEVALGSETVLLVEDEDIVRALSRQALESYGYSVIEAKDGVEALEIIKSSTEHIDLLFTDVIMPRMGGRELVEKVLEVAPNLPVLYASGYTDDAIVRHGVLDNSANFIQKPYTLDDLARKVKNLFDAAGNRCEIGRLPTPPVRFCTNNDPALP